WSHSVNIRSYLDSFAYDYSTSARENPFTNHTHVQLKKTQAVSVQRSVSIKIDNSFCGGSEHLCGHILSKICMYSIDVT
ncbi:hypothetical protein CRM22_002314, partial [Opisthorchis felineus]